MDQHYLPETPTPLKPSYDALERRVRELEKGLEQRRRAEAFLPMDEALFRELFDHMTSGCAIYEVVSDGSRGRDYIVKNLNAAALNIEDKTLDEVVGRSLFDLRPNIDNWGLIPVLKKVWQTGVPEVFPVKSYKDENFANYYENYIFKLSSGEVVALYNDVTNQKRAEESLRRSESLYRTLVNAIPDLIWLKDLEGVYLGCNPAFERFFGAPESEIIGRTDYDFKDRELADFFRKHDKRAMAAGGPSMNEEVLTFALGGYHGMFETIKTPVRDADGKLAGVLGIARDITARKQAEDTLKENERRYREAQRMGKVGNWEYDLATETFWGSDEAKRIYGFDPALMTFATADVERCIPERAKVHQALVDLIQHDAPYNLEFTIQPASGGPEKVLRSMAELIKDADGTPRKVAGVVQDITQQKRAETEKLILERRLRHAQKMESIGQLAGGIAHNFNNILAAVIGYTELAREAVEIGSGVREDLTEALAAANRAKEMVRQILAFSRQSDEALRPVRIDTVARETLKLIRSTLPATIDIQQKLSSDAQVMANPTQVHQIFMNLCSNAAYAMAPFGGTLMVGLRDVVLGEAAAENWKLKPGDYLLLTVSDTGVGIAPDIIDSIFDPYFTTKGPVDGSGMGLAMVHGIVESYGGRIDVDSTLGKGSQFTICLPTTPRDGQSELTPPTQRNPAGTERIMFVDDEPSIANLGKQMLERLGYTVTPMTSSVEALERFKAGPRDFDLVITDLTMPLLTGDRLAAELMHIRPDIPVVLCTGYSKETTADFAAEIGIRAFACKPLSKAELAETVRRVLDASPRPTHETEDAPGHRGGG